MLPLRIHPTLLCTALCVVTVSVSAPSQAQPAPAPEIDRRALAERSGRMITIKGRVDDRLSHRVMEAANSAVRDGVTVLIFDIQATESEFGPCYELARKITRLGGDVKLKVAYISQTLTGHATLIALACNEIVLGTDGVKIGDAGHDPAEEITQPMRQAYEEIAGKNGHDVWIALGMLDRSLRLFEVETATAKRLRPEEKLDDVKRERAVLKQQLVKEQGQTLLMDAPQAKRLGLIRLTATSRRDVVAAYGLPERVAAEDALRDEALRPVILRLEGSVNARMRQYALRRLKQVVDRGSNFVIVEIDSTHGDEVEASKIANALDSLPAKKVAFVQRQASGPATLLLFACDELVMTPSAMIGGFQTDGSLSAPAVELAKDSKVPAAWVQGLVDPNVIVVQMTNAKNPRVKGYFTSEQAADAEKSKDWAQPKSLKAKGEILELDGQKAYDLDVAAALCASEQELQQRYDLGGRVPTLQADWVDSLVDLLTGAGGTFFLLLVAFICLYIEFQIPGFGVAGLVSVLCFSLFFWSRFLSDTANSLEIVLFLLGIGFLALELFVIPGFGVAGVVGVALVLGSLFLASQSFTIPRTESETRELMTNIITMTASMVVFIVSVVGLARVLPSTPMFRRMVLAPPSELSLEVSPDIEDGLDHGLTHELVGQRGVAMSPLRPAGRMKLDDRFYDVIAQGAFVEPGRAIEVVSVSPYRIVVREVA